MSLRLVLLDRDGVLNVDRPKSVRSPEELEMLPGAAAAVARLNRAGVRVAVVTNQSVVGRGLIDAAMLERIHERLSGALATSGAHLDALLSCPDHPDRPTPRRKPGPGMLQEALAAFGAEAAETPMVGDALRDLQAAAAAGCPRILVRTGKGAETEAAGLPEAVRPVACFDDLSAAVDSLLAQRLS
ncbi:MAG: HAD-IIIA family hydrolase [Acetobacterales bacterium]